MEAECLNGPDIVEKAVGLEAFEDRPSFPIQLLTLALAPFWRIF